MQIRFLLGPAGSGKTFRCLQEIRQALLDAPEGLPLILLAPKQATFQLERQLLSDRALAGYTRLRIVSFERLAELVFDELHLPQPGLLAEEGRVMVLRALLGQKQKSLQLFRASARLPGFAQQLSLLLRELQQHHLSVPRLEQLAQRLDSVHRLDHKLQDLALILRAYQDWLNSHDLQDLDRRLDLAAEVLQGHGQGAEAKPRPLAAGLWLDGFAQMTPQETKLLATFVPHCRAATLAFCLEGEPPHDLSWQSHWALVAQSYQRCREAVVALPGCELQIETLARNPAQGRFCPQPALQHLEQHWARPNVFVEAPETSSPPPHEPERRSTPHPSPLLVRGGEGEEGRSAVQGGHVRNIISGNSPPAPSPPLHIFECANPEAESILAAREILRFVRKGGRFRDVAVVVRKLDAYHDPLRRVFARYQIPFFLDRREAVAHHPLAELTRGALRTIAFGWRQADWFSALKSGLASASEHEIDRLENEALARGWEGKSWFSELKMEPNTASGQVEQLRRRLIGPFQQLAQALSVSPTGRQLAEAIGQFWEQLRVRRQLEHWSGSASEEEDLRLASAVHATVWDQMQEWLKNVALAFAQETMPLPVWLPILESGLAGLTVGVIPPVLDQVLIGAIDRSRNPDLKKVFVLGLNETIFPALPTAPSLLTETDRARLELEGVSLGPNKRLQLGLERFYGYIACTRARDELVLTYSLRNTEGKALNPSSLLKHVQRLFPAVPVERFTPPRDWADYEHAGELIAPLLRMRPDEASGAENMGNSSLLPQGTSGENEPFSGAPGDLKQGFLFPTLFSPAGEQEKPPFAGSPNLYQRQFETLAALPTLGPALARLGRLHPANVAAQLSSQMAAELYGPVLRTSVSRLEQFAACPFRFFIHSGLQAEERVRFELDPRQQGSFQHEVLARFHTQLQHEQKHWRQITPAEARQRVGRIADALMPNFEQGVLVASDQNRFLARLCKESLQRFIEAAVDWMQQYEFNPHQVELAFGTTDAPLPPWELDLGEGHRLAFRGRIDRVDLWRAPGSDQAWCVVIDYKSGQRKLDPLLLAHGIQQQLPAYLSVLRRLQEAKPVFGASRLRPGGVFYVSLRGGSQGGLNRSEVFAEKSQGCKRPYVHQGVFDLAILRKLDNREGTLKGDQFTYRLKANGKPVKGSPGALPSAAFTALLDDVERVLRQMGKRIYAGEVQVDPYRKGRDCACDTCDYRGICRIDPWTHHFRVLKKREARSEDRG